MQHSIQLFSANFPLYYTADSSDLSNDISLEDIPNSNFGTFDPPELSWALWLH